jgi:hypothetical protein
VGTKTVEKAAEDETFRPFVDIFLSTMREAGTVKGER